MKWVSEPLVHFLLLGAGLFALFALVGEAERDRHDRIVVSAAQVEILAEGFVRAWRRPPTTAELAGLVDEHVREEIIYREALAMGLDRDDTVIRRRLRQKLDFISDDLLALRQPTAAELEAYLAENPDKFRGAGRISFTQVFLSRDLRGESAATDAEHMLGLLSSSPDLDSADLGDRSLLPGRLAAEPLDRVASRFGGRFVDELAALPVGEWSGPVESSYGFHLVFVSARAPSAMPALNEVRNAVEREWRADARERAAETSYRQLRERYEVVVEEPAAVAESRLAVLAPGEGE